jgi:hypothetical protein
MAFDQVYYIPTFHLSAPLLQVAPLAPWSTSPMGHSLYSAKRPKQELHVLQLVTQATGGTSPLPAARAPGDLPMAPAQRWVRVVSHAFSL